MGNELKGTEKNEIFWCYPLKQCDRINEDRSLRFDDHFWNMCDSNDIHF
uniref:Uncharacterized protein n=1 Tax=Ascaris lumbricoides TaxID=6252 RepID=A0A0M3IDV4_ASCLU